MNYLERGVTMSSMPTHTWTDLILNWCENAIITPMKDLHTTEQTKALYEALLEAGT